MRRIILMSAVAAIAMGAGMAHATASGASELDSIRRAKIGLSWFILDHVDRPTRITEPCPALSSESLGAHLGALGLVPSDRDYGAAIVVDADVGEGLAVLRCGVDIAQSANPSGSVAVSVDVFMLDGRATFDQVAVDIGGNDVVVEAVAEPLGETAGRCTSGGSSCERALERDGFVVVVRARGLPAEQGDQLARQLVTLIAPEIVVNLAALAAG